MSKHQIQAQGFTISFVLVPTLASLAVPFNLTEHVDGDKVITGNLGLCMFLQGQFLLHEGVFQGPFQWLRGWDLMEWTYFNKSISSNKKQVFVFLFKLTVWWLRPVTGEAKNSKCVLYVLTQFILKLFTLAHCQLFTEVGLVAEGVSPKGLYECLSLSQFLRCWIAIQAYFSPLKPRKFSTQAFLCKLN